MNVKLAAQTLSSSVADAIQFLDFSMKLEDFQHSSGTVKFVRTIDRLFDIRNPLGKGFKQPLRRESRDIWEEILKSTANYLLSLRTNTIKKELLSTHPRKTFVIGFVISIKSTIEMANEMFSAINQPFKYLLTYKFSQDHIELLFSCIRAKGGWNNNPNCLQLKYAMKKMLLRNAVTASKNVNCQNFLNYSTTIIPFFHTSKHNAPLKENATENCHQQNQITDEANLLLTRLNSSTTSEFTSNVLFYINGYIVAKLVKELSCSSCKSCLLSHYSTPTPEHDYCTMKYNEVASASAFTLFVNNGGLRVPSQSVYSVVEYAEKLFKANVCQQGQKITTESRLKQKMMVVVCSHFVMDCNCPVFDDHEQGLNENVFEDDHKLLLNNEMRGPNSNTSADRGNTTCVFHAFAQNIQRFDRSDKTRNSEN